MTPTNEGTISGGNSIVNLTETDKRKLRDAFAVKASLNGNMMNFIGLDEVRARFPSMWKRHQERIRATTQTILSQFTDPVSDIVLPVGEVNFVVLFTRLNQSDALLRATMIKAEILRRFIGDEALNPLDMEIQAIEMGSGEMVSGTLASLLASQATAPSDASEMSSPIAALQKPDAIPAEPTSANANAVDLAGLEARFRFSFDDVEVGYLPFLNHQRNEFTVFAGRAVRRTAIGDTATDYGVLPGEADFEQVATLDKLVLAGVRRGLVDMALHKRAAIVIVPVSFETMSNRAAASEYLGRLQQVPSDLRSYVVSSLCRCPAGIPEGRLAEIIHPLNQLTRAVGVRVEKPTQMLAPIKAVGAFSVGFRLRDLSPSERSTPGLLRAFAARARKLGLQTFVDEIDDPELALLCRAARINHVGGRVIAPLSDAIGVMTERSVA